MTLPTTLACTGVHGWRAVSSATGRYANSDQFNRLRRPRYPTAAQRFRGRCGRADPAC
ncbi:hypothetical protein ABIA39_001798 [Nocardia sp. GAS34]